MPLCVLAALSHSRAVWVHVLIKKEASKFNYTFILVLSDIFRLLHLQIRDRLHGLCNTDFQHLTYWKLVQVWSSSGSWAAVSSNNAVTNKWKAFSYPEALVQIPGNRAVRQRPKQSQGFWCTRTRFPGDRWCHVSTNGRFLVWKHGRTTVGVCAAQRDTHSDEEQMWTNTSVINLWQTHGLQMLRKFATFLLVCQTKVYNYFLNFIFNEQRHFR